MDTSKKINIVIVGAGIAGIAAARKLHDQGHHVIVLEARDRTGGRIHTYNWEGMPIDLGAAWIHGDQNNPLTSLVHQFGVETKETDFKKMLFFDKNHYVFSPEEFASKIEKLDKLYQLASDFSKLQSQDLSLAEAINKIKKQHQELINEEIFNWYKTRINLYTGADLENISAKYYDQEEVFEGKQLFLINGYRQIIEGLAKDINIKLDMPVKQINYLGDQVEIITPKEIFKCDKVIVTVPLGVLQKQNITFNPILPDYKQAAIQNLKMGTHNKFILKFPKIFWPSEYQFFSHSSPAYKLRAYLNYSYLNNQPILETFAGGALGTELEKHSDHEIIIEAMKGLRFVFGNKIPSPTSYLITRWNHDVLSSGSYSYIPVGSSPEDMDNLAQPIMEKVFFAGEATDSRYFANVHGAYFSGLRVAENASINT